MEKAESTKYINVYTEISPNPESLKFVVNFALVAESESFDFPSLEEAENSPLAKELFQFEYVDRVFIASNFVTVTKKENKSWEELIPELRSFIKDYLEAEKPIISENKSEKDKAKDADSVTISRIKEVLNEYVKPAVEMDGGAIQFHSFDEQEGLLKVSLQGSCSGCPSSVTTLKNGIENLMQSMVPTVKQVEAAEV